MMELEKGNDVNEIAPNRGARFYPNGFGYLRRFVRTSVPLHFSKELP